MKIHSVLGLIDSENLGDTLAHEHISCADWSMRMNFGSKYFDFEWVAKKGAAMLQKAREQCQIRTMVDGTPINLGRDIKLIAEVSRRSGVNIIASSGFYYQEEPCLMYRSVEEIDEFLDRECSEGIDDTGILPGILKCAVGSQGLTPMLKNILLAIGRVAKRRQLPIFCHHAVSARSGMEILDIFEKSGADLSRVIVGHSGDTDDCDYLCSMLKRGCFLGMDRFAYCDITLSLDKRLGVIAELFQKGYGRQLILSHDLVVFMGGQGTMDDEKKKPQLKGNMDFTFIHHNVLPPLLKSGLTQQDIHQLMVENPKYLLSGNDF